jgi:uncharacterized membrane protein required for colicin V production
VLLFAFIGMRGGLWWQLVRLLGLIASVAVARALAPHVASGLESVFEGLAPRTAEGLAWCLVLGVGMWIVAIVGRSGATQGAAKDGGPAQGLSFVDRTGGAAAGALTGIVLHAALLLCIGNLAAPDWTQARLRGSHSRELVSTLGRGIPGLIDVHAAESLGLAAEAH